jgi:hypothetical protein
MVRTDQNGRDKGAMSKKIIGKQPSTITVDAIMLARSAKGSKECTRLASREEVEKKKWQGEEVEEQEYKRVCARRDRARHRNKGQHMQSKGSIQQQQNTE